MSAFAKIWEAHQKQVSESWQRAMTAIIDQNPDKSDQEVARLIWSRLHDMSPEQPEEEDETFQGQVRVVRMWREIQQKRKQAAE